MKALTLITACIMLSGCAAVDKIAAYAAQANDEAVVTSKFTICNAASVGSIKRAFDTPEKVKVWKELCNDKTTFEP